MSKPLDIEWISTPTSLAPGTARKRQRLALVGEHDVGRVLHDDDLVLLGEVDHAVVEVARRDRAGRAVRVVDDQQLGASLHVGGNAVEVGKEAVLAQQRQAVDLAAVVARVRAGDGIARARS